MIKKTITFEDLDGNKITEDFYFNLSKAELLELETSTKIGFSETLQRLVKEEDNNKIIEYFKKIILLSYGVRSDDGRRFIKSQELRDSFEQTDAYSELFMELATQADAGSAFINGIVPSSISKAIEDAEKTQAKPISDMSREELLEAFKTQSRQ
jgi:hypothetical protein